MTIRYAQEIVLRADRRLGEMLAETPKAKGGAGDPKRSHTATTSTPKLTDVGLTKSESSRAQKIAAIVRPVGAGVG